MGLKDTMKKMSDRMDVSCDRCGKIMRPGGSVGRNMGGEDHQFCCAGCADAFKPGDKAS